MSLMLLQSEIDAYWTDSILKKAFRFDFVTEFGRLERE
jgi:hypothetical protein